MVDSSHGDGATNFQEVLEMCACVSFAFPQKGLACTMLMSAGFSSKVASPVSTAGPVGIWAAEGAKNSQIVFWAMAYEVDGAETTGVVADRQI